MRFLVFFLFFALGNSHAELKPLPDELASDITRIGSFPFWITNNPKLMSRVTSVESYMAITDLIYTLRETAASGIPEQLNYAIKKAKLVSLVNSLSDGVESFIGEKGIRLSGGERQRVALARACYHDKNILVMDESTSSLDVETEKEIIKEIKNLRGTKTLIVIAHRMSTIQHCNRIYHIENGRVIKSGKFEEIVS